MRNMTAFWKTYVPNFVAWAGVAAGVVAIVIGMGGSPQAALAQDVVQPEAPSAFCLSDSMLVIWSAAENGQAEAPVGWKLEQRRWESGRWVVQTFTFIGAQADGLLSEQGDSWLWDDENVDRNSPYTYRVRAIDADGSDTADRTWSPRTSIDCLSDTLNQPGLSLPRHHVDGLSMLWRTPNNGLNLVPDGWKVERRHLDPQGRDGAVQRFRFIGLEADALLTVDGRYWGWVDTTAEREVEYTYRVRAINADGSDLDGTGWSRDASGMRLAEFLDRPGISVPRLTEKGVSMFWHTQNRGEAKAPDGWKVERRHWASDGWVVQTFTFIGSDADALQTHSELYWDWVDDEAGFDEDYTFRVRAINVDGSDTEGRLWSRRAPVEDCPCDDQR